jgi:hypothetical protein
MLLFDRPHQRRRAAQRFLRVHVSAGRRQDVDDLRLTVPRRQHQHRLTVGPALLDVGAALDELVDHRHIAVQAGHRQRRHAFAIRGVDFDAGANQQVGGVKVVAIHGPMKCRRSIDLRRVHVGLALQKRSQRRLVAFHDGIGDLARSGGGGQVRGRGKHERRRGHEESVSIHAIPLEIL